MCVSDGESLPGIQMGILWLVECFSILMKRINYNGSVISFPAPRAAVMKSKEPSVLGSPLSALCGFLQA